MALTYKTVAGSGTAEYVDRRSRFIGTVQPVTSEQEALDFIAAKKKEYWDARHNVYAYVIRENGISRFSDDNEPQGTAGVPVLDVLQKQGVTDCVVVVTRYFGGILLGTGGLVRAYSQSASLALEAAGVIERRLCAFGTVECDYAQYGWLPALIAECGGKTDDAVFADAVTVSLHLPVETVGTFEAQLTDRSCGTLAFRVTEERYDSF
jgi:uncharacterized YigZ family protein